MRQSLKVTLSILISLLLCGGFAVFSFTGFFEVLETSFFQPAIIEGREKQLQDFADRISGYHRDNIERFSPAVGEPFVWRAFADSNQQSTQDIIDLQNLFGTFLDEYPNLQLVRFLGKEGRKIHFSTAVSDIESQNQERRKYLDYADIGETINPEALLVSAGESPRLIIDGQGQRFIYSIPIIVSTGQYRGVAVFYFSKRDLSEYLFRFPSLDFRELLLLDGGVVINFPEAGIELVADTILEIWSKNESTSDVYREAIVFESPDAQDLPYSLLTVSTDDFGSISVLVPYSVLQLQPFMKAIVIAAFSLTVFLIVFLIFNLRQDPILILSQRIKRLQLGVLQDFIEGKESVDWQRWRDELVSGKSELKSRIKRGLGRIPAGKEAELDGMIDKSWAEIISVIETRVGEPRREAVDVSHIEQLIQRALDQGAFTMKAQVPVEEKRPPRRAGIVVEEIAVDEVVEPGEVIPAEELEEAEAVEEAEEAEAVEEVEEAEAVEEAEELEEAEAVE
jgi:hypothetical protein